MPAAFDIRYITREEIDVERWDDCIAQASNSLLYAHSIYLDHMAGRWDALILPNYSAVMPLPWREKYTLRYLYQPFLTAQLGVFGNHLTQEVVEAFLKAIPKKFRYWDFSLNHYNLFSIIGYPFRQRVNYTLCLQPAYETIYNGYRQNIQRNCKKAISYGCRIVTNVSINNVIELNKFHGEAGTEQDIENFKLLFYALQKKHSAKTYGVLSKAGELIASAVFLFGANRAYYIFVGNHPNSRTLGASHALLNAFIKDHAAQNLVLDFEGSDINNLAFFYSSFGATQENYPAIQFNRLPWWARWAKNR